MSELDDFGLGVFGQGTVTLKEKLDIVAGLRVDYENKNADLKTFFDPAIAPPTVVVAEDSFGTVSPQFAVAYRLQPRATSTRQCRAATRLAASTPRPRLAARPTGRKTPGTSKAASSRSWANGRVALNSAVFFIDWNDLQLNVPNLNVPGQIYIANVGGASSKGIEFDLTARPRPTSTSSEASATPTRLSADGSASVGLDVSGNDIPNTPDYTASLGVQYGRAINSATSAYGRADAGALGRVQVRRCQFEGQDAYSLINFRGGVRGKLLFVEGWVRNAFNTTYIPVAFAYGPLAPSGFIGENGAPRTFGLRAGVTF